MTTAESANSTLHLVEPGGIVFPHLGCDLVPSKTEPPDVLLAIATDLLAQAEAQHRMAARLEHAARQLSGGARERVPVVPPIDRVRDQLRVMRDLFDAERVLLEEFERELAGGGE